MVDVVAGRQEWFTSDQHFGHRKVIDYCHRPFADVDAMHRELIARHNARVCPGDIVWHLGDFSLDEKHARDLLPVLHGEHQLVAGNHDECHPAKHSKSHDRYVRRYRDFGFKSIHLRTADIERGGAVLRLCHFPAVGDHTHEARYPEYRPLLEGCDYLLHGHVHDAFARRGKQINVGVDVRAYEPRTLAELLAAPEEAAPRQDVLDT